MPSMSDFMENRVVDAIFRGGAMNLAGALGSSAVVKGLWTLSTLYAVGDIVIPVANASAGGKFLQCTAPGTSGASFATALGNPGATVADNTVTWTVVSGMPSPLKLWISLWVINKGLRVNSNPYAVGDVVSVTTTAGATGGDLKQHLYRCTAQTGNSAAAQGAAFIGLPGESVTDGLVTWIEIGPVFDANTGFPAGLFEVSGGSYARVLACAGAAQALADWAGTQAAASTAASNGTGGTTSNNAPVTFAAPTAPWANGFAQIGAVGIHDQSSGGNLLFWGVMTAPKTVNGGDSAPAFSISTLTLQVDN